MSRKAFFLEVLFEWFFFFADSSRKKVFQPIKSPYFCVGQQKKTRKEPAKKIAVFWTCITATYDLYDFSDRKSKPYV